MTVTMCALICAESGNRCCSAHNSLERSVEYTERIIASLMSLGSLSPVRSWCLPSRVCPGLEDVREVIYFGSFFFAEVRFACCRPDFVQLPMGYTGQLVFAKVPDLVPVHVPEVLPELPPPSLKPRTVATLGPLLSSGRSLRFSTRKFAASCCLAPLFLGSTSGNRTFSWRTASAWKWARHTRSMAIKKVFDADNVLLTRNTEQNSQSFHGWCC